MTSALSALAKSGLDAQGGFAIRRSCRTMVGVSEKVHWTDPSMVTVRPSTSLARAAANPRYSFRSSRSRNPIVIAARRNSNPVPHRTSLRRRHRVWLIKHRCALRKNCLQRDVEIISPPAVTAYASWVDYRPRASLPPLNRDSNTPAGSTTCRLEQVDGRVDVGEVIAEVDVEILPIPDPLSSRPDRRSYAAPMAKCLTDPILKTSHRTQTSLLSNWRSVR